MGKFLILVSKDPPSNQALALINAIEQKLDYEPVIKTRFDLKDLDFVDQLDLIVITPGLSVKGYELIKTLKLGFSHPLLPVMMLTKSGHPPTTVKGIRIEPDVYARWPSSVASIAGQASTVIESRREEFQCAGLRKKLILHVQNELRYLFKVNNLISSQFSQIGLAEDEIVNLRLTLDELGTNAIRHGNRNIHDKMVIIRCLIYETYLSIAIEDQGPGFCVSEIPDPTATERILLPSGRGIFIARQLMDKVQYLGSGNCVEISKKLAKSPETTTSAR